jgi:SAM-dependent methyltransferase
MQPDTITRRLVLASAVLPAELLFAQTEVARAQPTDDQVAKAFRAWDEQSTQPGLWATLYTEKLRADGVSKEEIDRRIAVILRVLDRKDLANRQYRREYNSPGNDVFRVTPTEWVAQVVTGLKPGKALDVGMGNGRNSLFLARKGWDVTGVDLSDRAVEQARQEALRAGVAYTAVAADLDQFDFGKNRWDLIVLIFTPDRWTEKICDGLRPGGLFVREQYARVVSGEDMEDRRRAVAKRYVGLQIKRYEEVLDPKNYSPSDEEAAISRTRPATVARLTATKA